MPCQNDREKLAEALSPADGGDSIKEAVAFLTDGEVQMGLQGVHKDNPHRAENIRTINETWFQG